MRVKCKYPQRDLVRFSYSVIDLMGFATSLNVKMGKTVLVCRSILRLTPSLPREAHHMPRPEENRRISG